MALFPSANTLPDHLEQRLHDVESHLQNAAVSTVIENVHAEGDDDAFSQPFEPHQEHLDHSDFEQITATPVAALHLEAASTQPRRQAGERVEGVVAGNNAVLDHLPDSAVFELCKYWFQRYHRWFPILHQHSFTQELNNPGNDTFRNSLVVRAIVAITLQHSPLSNLNSGRLEELQDRLCDHEAQD